MYLTVVERADLECSHHKRKKRKFCEVMTIFDDDFAVYSAKYICIKSSCYIQYRVSNVNYISIKLEYNTYLLINTKILHLILNWEMKNKLGTLL